MNEYNPISTEGFGSQLRVVVNNVEKSTPKPSYILTGGQICVMLKHVTKTNLFRHIHVVLVNTPINLFDDNLQISYPGGSVQVSRQGILTGALIQIKTNVGTDTVNAVIFAVKTLIEEFNKGVVDKSFELNQDEHELLKSLNVTSN